MHIDTRESQKAKPLCDNIRNVIKTQEIERTFQNNCYIEIHDKSLNLSWATRALYNQLQEEFQLF
jgi:hypothetical protein